MSEFILASGSSRRHSLLNQLNLGYSTSIPDVDESVMVGEAATAYVSRVARSKALTVYERESVKQVVLAADTIISLSGEIIGKPRNQQQVKTILRKLSACEHDVFTALCLKTPQRMHEEIVATKVKFRKISDSEIHAYCLTSEPYDKAGAYAIQGQASAFVEYITGSYTNVMGLPLVELCNLLKQENLYDLDAV